MTKRSELATLQDMLEHTKEALSFVADIDFDQFVKDRKGYLAVVHLIQIVGEGASRVSE